MSNARQSVEEAVLDGLRGQPPSIQRPTDIGEMAENFAGAEAEKDAQVERVQETADRGSDLLLELTALAAGVETSNRNTEQVLLEIRAHRENAAEQQRKQDRSNVLLSVADLLVGAGSVVVVMWTGGRWTQAKVDDTRSAHGAGALHSSL